MRDATCMRWKAKWIMCNDPTVEHKIADRQKHTGPDRDHLCTTEDNARPSQLHLHFVHHVSADICESYVG